MNTAIISNGDRTRHLKVPLPPQAAQRIDNGIRILHRYQQLLNANGQALLQSANYLFSPSQPITPSEMVNRLGELFIELPSLNTPQLELFKKPQRTPFEEVLKAKHSKFFVELNNGCETQCTFCGVEAPSRLKQMPFFLFLAVAEVLGQFEARLRFMDYRSDPFQYRDVLFGANLGDAITSALDDLALNGNVLPLQTHGWPAHHKFAQPAAEKIHQMGLRIQRLSIHLFHKEFERAKVSPDTYELYAERFARAINLLRPTTIAFRYDNFDRINQKRSLGATARFYQEFVQPRLSPELESNYRIWINEGWPHLVCEDKVRLEFSHNSFQEYLYASEHLADEATTLFVKEEKKEAALVVYPDGMYSLFKSDGKNSIKHQLGNLF
jgi:hypothetical protein